MEFFVVLAVSLILWMMWQLHRARQFNKFKRMINRELKPVVVKQLQVMLDEQRCATYPNNEAHQHACIYYWSQYPSRILQAAIAWEVVEENWLEQTGNVRHGQHLLHIESDKLAKFVERIEIKKSAT